VSVLDGTTAVEEGPAAEVSGAVSVLAEVASSLSPFSGSTTDVRALASARTLDYTE
jgi:hypothetical protein